MSQKLFVIFTAPVFLPLLLAYSIAVRLKGAAYWVYLDMAQEIESMAHIWKYGFPKRDSK
jgi:hypothetical protein